MNQSALLSTETPQMAPNRPKLLLVFLLCTCFTASAQLTPSQSTDQQSQQSNQPLRTSPFPTVAEHPKVNITNVPGDQTFQQPTIPQLPVGVLEEGSMREPDLEFQDFVTSSLGYRLPIFGQNLFQGVPSTFAPLEYAPVTPEYLIGPGDELLVRGWGQIDITNFRAVVDRTGAIYLPTVGMVSVAGVRYDHLNQYLKQAISRYYKNFDLDVTLGRLRSIQIFVVGQVRRPGSYTVSSLSTLINALFASGGPSKRGSMRNIQLKRNGQVVTTFDFYDLLVRGDKSKDAQLMPGDVIYVPSIGRLVALAGSVNVPANYELKDHDTLGDVLNDAGGLTTTAAGQQAFIERIDAHQLRREDQFPLTADGFKKELNDGDVLRFLHISPRFENAVTLRGNVAVPGRFPWHEGMRIKDLIPNREFLVTEEYWKRQNRLGLNPAGETFQLEEDMVRPIVTPAPQPAVQTPSQVQITQLPPGTQVPQGVTLPPSVQALPGQQTMQPATVQTVAPQTAQTGVLGDQNLAERVGRTEAQRMKQEELKNQIKRSAAEINWEYAVIQRLDPDKLTSHLLPFNLGKAIEGDENQNLSLHAGDVITIFSQADMQVPIAQQSKFVRLEGEFGSAGIYQVEPGETLRHLVTRVGGATQQAYFFGSEFTRESVREDLQRRLDDYTSDLQRSVESTVAVSAEDQQRLAINRRLVSRMQQLRSTGRIVLEVKPNADSVSSYADMVLEDGDRLFIPFRPSTVNVAGSVYNNSAFLYRPEKTVSDYLRLAGGVTRDGDKGHAFVLRANGATVSNQHTKGFMASTFASLRLMPGDTIVVPQKLDRGATLRALKDWSQVFQQFALGAAGVAVLLP